MRVGWGEGGEDCVAGGDGEGVKQGGWRHEGGQGVHIMVLGLAVMVGMPGGGQQACCVGWVGGCSLFAHTHTQQE